MSDPSILRDKGGFLSPVIRVVPRAGGRAVLKDFGSKNPLTRNLLAPILVRREFCLLRRLEGIPGIPRAYAIIGRHALMTEYIAGRTIGKFRPGELPDRVYHALEETLRSVHRRGVLHLDLRQKKNILISEADGRPYLIDFANAVRVDAASPWRGLARRLQDVDRSGLLKFKARNFPHLLTGADRAFLQKHERWRRFWIFSPHTLRERDSAWRT